MSLRNNRFGSFCSARNFALGLGLCLNVSITVSSSAQDTSPFTHFFLNPYILNPSYAGFDGQPAISLTYRRQWMTIDGAPTMTNLSLHAPVNSRVGAGINIGNDSKGFFNNSSVLFSVAYHVPVRDHTFIRFGLSGGGSWNTVDMVKLREVNDPALASVLDQSASLVGNAGMSFHHHFFTFGASLPALFSPVYVSESAFTVKEVKPFQALVLHVSNRFYFNDNKNIFEPYVLYRVNTGLPAQFELAGVLHLNHVVWAGVSYRQHFGPTALGGIKLKNSLAIGASYSLQQSGSDELNSPSFEVSLNYLFGTHKRGVPVYSFVNAVRPKERRQTRAVAKAATARKEQSETASKRNETKAAQQESKRLADAQARKEAQAARAKAEATKREGEVSTSNEDLVRRSDETPPVNLADERVTEVAAAEQTDAGVREGHPAHDQEQIQRVQAHIDNPNPPVEVPFTIPEDVRHETVRRGSHAAELETSQYVVVGVFKSTENAKHFSDGLRSLDFNTNLGYLSAKDLWYVYIFRTDSIESAQTQQARYSKLFLFRDAWLLTVEP